MAEPLLPIVIDLGKKKGKRISQLKRGEGALVQEVQEALAEVRDSLGSQAASKELVPVVVVYKKKVKGNGRLRLPFF
jgi:hypothetical protein